MNVSNKELQTKEFQIDSFDTVNNFLLEIYNRTGSMFDPAEDIKGIRDKTGACVFKEDESDYLNEVLTECFIFCVLNDLNIYTLAAIAAYNLNKRQPS